MAPLLRRAKCPIPSLSDIEKGDKAHGTTS